MSIALEKRILALQTCLTELHASPWQGVLEEVGTGSWVQTLLQSVPGASATLWAAATSYAREAQLSRYGADACAGGRAVACETVSAWARHNLHAKPDAQFDAPADTQAAFFSLAISGSVASDAASSGDQHAWLALALADGKGWVLHLRLPPLSRLEQQVGLGEVGVSLLGQLAAQSPEEVSLSPVNLALPPGFQLDFWQGWHLSPFENTLQACELLQAGQAELLLFQPQAGILNPLRPLEALRGKKLLLHKGAFNPLTLAHLTLPQEVLKQEPDCVPVLEISLSNADKGQALSVDLAHRLQMLAFQPWLVALTCTPALYQTAELFRQAGGAARVDFVCGQDLYCRVFEPRYYTSLAGGLTGGLERLFAQETQLWVCGRETDLVFSEAAQAAAQHWAERCKHLDLHLPVASTQIRQAVAAGQAGWEAAVLPEVANYIRAQGLYLTL